MQNAVRYQSVYYFIYLNSMSQRNFLKHIEIDVFSATPKYRQLAQSIIKGISEGRLKQNEVLPSINELSNEFDVSRDTVEKSYKYLKKINVLGSVPGKGFYVKAREVKNDIRIFLLFNKLSTHKKIIYDAFVKTLGNEAMIDFYIYNNDFNLFKKLIDKADASYNYFVIIAHFLDSDKDACDILNTLPKEKLILLDKLVPGVTGEFSAVYEDFEHDIYVALEKALPELKKYKTLKLILPEHTYFPTEIINGFKKFCTRFAFSEKIVHDVKNETIKMGTAYICLMEDDLVTLVEMISSRGPGIGKNIGVISYNETPLKKIILKGITTISTDFEKMGMETARLILSGQKNKIAIPFHLRLRPSL